MVQFHRRCPRKAFTTLLQPTETRPTYRARAAHAHVLQRLRSRNRTRGGAARVFHGKGAIIGVGRLSKARGLNEAEFALIVSDRYQRKGLGTELLKRLVQVGRDEKLARITASILAENYGMHHVSKNVGFTSDVMLQTRTTRPRSSCKQDLPFMRRAPSGARSF